MVFKTVCQKLVLALAASLLGISQAAAERTEIIFSTAPTQSPAKTIEMYQPIADYLTRTIGMKVVLKPASTFLEYIQNMHAGKYDLVFDGPHFVGWRMKARDHLVLAKLPGKLRFVVVVREDQPRIKKLKHLAGRKVCAFASPNLLTLGLLYKFPNPARIPRMVKVNNFKGALQCVKSGKGVAAVMRDKFWEKRKPEQKKGLRVLYLSDSPTPHRAFSISDEVSKKVQDKIRAALLSKEGAAASKKVLKRFRSKAFVEASDPEYRGHWKLLKPVYGFHN